MSRMFESRETDKDTMAEVAKRRGVSESTIYAWRKKFGSPETDEMKRLRTLGSRRRRPDSASCGSIRS
ncbi:MAG TPA: hypothetical protein DIU11_11335 [Pusillimonas sp.]|nr:hypothetical protein [Pusillimonas sp.]